ncbi:hypothetical protein BG003_010396 [Podila horticola]|nr:hypothetical protein BG003_010396 [Podila horticola]
MDFPSDPFHQVRIGLQDYKEMIEMVTTNRAGDRNKYSDFITSRDYNRTKILDALSEISGSNMSIQHEKASMLQEIATLDQLVPEVDDYGRMLELPTMYTLPAIQDTMSTGHKSFFSNMAAML